MTIDEYKQELKQLEKEFNADKKTLIINCARSNNTVQVGDIISSENFTIEVGLRQAVLTYTGLPTMVYSGIWITKAGHTNKRGETHTVYQNNIINKEGE